MGFAKEGAKVVVAARSEVSSQREAPGHHRRDGRRDREHRRRSPCRPVRRHRRGERERHGGGDPREVRPHRRPGQQRRHRFPVPLRGDALKRWEIVLRVEHHRPVPLLQGRDPRHEQAGRRQHRQHHLQRRRRAGQRDRGLQRHLRRLEGGSRPLHLGPGRRGGQEQHRRQRGEALGRGQHRGHAHVGHARRAGGWKSPASMVACAMFLAKQDASGVTGLRGLRRRVRLLARPEGRDEVR